MAYLSPTTETLVRVRLTGVVSADMEFTFGSQVRTISDWIKLPVALTGCPTSTCDYSIERLLQCTRREAVTIVNQIYETSN